MKDLPPITHDNYANIAAILHGAKGLDSFNPFLEYSELSIDNLNHQGRPFNLWQNSYRGYRIFNLQCSQVMIRMAFHKDPEEWPGCPDIAGKMHNNGEYYWAEIESLVSEIRGTGNGTFTVHLLDALLSQVAKNTGVPLFAFADDDSRPRGWTTAAFQSVGYSLEKMGVLGWLHIRRPRLYRWYQPNASQQSSLQKNTASPLS